MSRVASRVGTGGRNVMIKLAADRNAKKRARKLERRERKEAACTCPEETPNEVASIQRHPDGTVTCGVCGGVTSG